MSGPVSQSESNRIYARLQNAVKSLLDVKEEIDRLESLNASFNLSLNLDEHSGGEVTKAEAIACFQALASYRQWFNNATVAFDTTNGGPERRAKLDPFLLANSL